jgi:hypothetical protein
MADYVSEVNDVVLSVARARDHCSDPSRSVRPRMALVGVSVREVVTSAGGWVFDHTMAGWDAYVAVCDLEGARALRILGARCVERGASHDAGEPGPLPHMLLVSAELYRLDSRVRDGVWNIVRHGGTALTMWGSDCPVELERWVSTALYRISAAASAFKPLALAASGAGSTSEASDEVFHTVRPSVLSLASLN